MQKERRCTNQVDCNRRGGSGSMVQEQNDEDVDDDGAAMKSVGKRN
jgi:hypothetical protein